MTDLLQYRTPQSVGLCRTMREAQAFHGLPILADALEEAGCADADLLERLRTPHLSSGEARLLVGRCESEDTAAAVAAVEALSAAVGDPDSYGSLTVAELLEAADAYVDAGEHCHMRNNERYKDVTCVEMRRFWAAYKLLSHRPELTTHADSWYNPGEPIDDDNFFSCSC